MKKRTLSKLKSIFTPKKGKKQQSNKPSRSPSPERAGATSPAGSASYRPIARTPPPARVGPPPSPPVPTNPVAPVAPEPSGPVHLTPCLVCGRTFVPQSLDKHVKICEKMLSKKRKTFDSSRQRREGTDLEQFLPKNFGLPENSPFLEKSPPNTAKTLPKTKPSVKRAIQKPTADLERCPHCGRAFGPRAFERHVEWCGDKAKILPPAPAAAAAGAVADAKQRLNARTQYRAPLTRGRRSSQTRDKSSNSRSASVESRGSPPRVENGEYRRGRTRASESVSSNDYHEETTPHVPVIRQAGARTNNSGDAHVRARQARLARDLSSTRKSPKPSTSQAPQSTDRKDRKSTTKEPPPRKSKNNLSHKKEQKLKTLENIVQKHSEKAQKRADEIKNAVPPQPKQIRKTERSMIPVPKKVIKTARSEKEEKPLETGKEVMQSPKYKKKSIQKIEKVNVKKDPIKLRESTISLDSLDEAKNVVDNSFMCPSIPCTIYQMSKNKKEHIKTGTSVLKTSSNNESTEHTSNDNIELLYKNPSMKNNNSVETKIELEFKYSPISGFVNSLATESTSDHLGSDDVELFHEENNDINIIEVAVIEKEDTFIKSNIDVIENDLSAEIFDDVEIQDLSDINIDETEDPHDSIENIQNDDINVEDISDNDIIELKSDYNDKTENSESMRHGSGETYTKFTENPADLEEFMTLTDQMMCEDYSDSDKQNPDDICIDLHTPATTSIETLQANQIQVATAPKPAFSDNLAELKANLKLLLDTSETETQLKNKNEQINLTLNVRDMEHITVYQSENSKPSKMFDTESVKSGSSEFKLPAINDHKIERKFASKKKQYQRTYKCNNTITMMDNRNESEHEVNLKGSGDGNSDNQSVTADAPPLKLPRIERKRVEDSYDPFLSAARQMKELMSSETNIPQKFNSTKDHNRTLPILRPNKDKNLLTNNRQDNSKTMKDSINRTYKKIPTLHRMKSFGSTNNDNNNTSTPFGARCSSFRINRNNKSSSQSLNTTFTKSSKENISSLSSSFNRNGLMNRSFSSYNNSTYSTPKPRDKIPKISTSMSHSFQRTTIKQPTKLEKAKQNDDKKEFVNLDTILVQDNLSMTDSNYIDPRLINENDNLPINVNTIRNNPDIISSMESLLTTENLPAKFDSFANVKNNNVETVNAVNKTLDNATNNNSNDKTSAAPTMDDLTTQYDKIMSSLEQSIASKTSIRDDDSLCEDFDLEEFMTNFDDDIKQKTRICSSTTRIIKQSELVDDNRTSEQNSICSTPKIVHSSSNGSIPFNKSMSLNFSSNSIAGDSLFPSSAKRSTSLLDSIQKKNSAKSESIKSRHNADQLEQDIMKSLKDFGRFYENESQPHKEIATYNATVVNGNGTARRDFRAKSEKKNKIQSDDHNGYTPNGKSSNDSAYSSLNRISPSKLSVCNSKELNGMDLDRIPAGSDSSDSQRDGGLRSVSSDEFLAMERSAEHEGAKAHDNNPAFGRLTSNDHGKGNREEKRTSSRASHTGTTRRARGSLSSSGSESSVPAAAAAAGGGHRLSRFCHECGNRFPVHTAKFCIECGCKRLVV